MDIAEKVQIDVATMIGNAIKANDGTALEWVNYSSRADAGIEHGRAVAEITIKFASVLNDNEPTKKDN